MFDNGRFPSRPGKTYWLSPASFRARVSNVRLASTSGTRCSTRVFMRAAGTVQTRASVSISGQVAQSTSAVLAAVRIRNSKAILTTR